jgi:hypothetical protein
MATELMQRRMPTADVASVRLAAAQAAAMAADLRRVRAALTNAAVEGWAGSAEASFTESVAAHAAQLDPVARRYDGYAAALAGYAARLAVVEPRLRAARARLDGAADQTGARLDAAADPAGAQLFEEAWQEWDTARRQCKRSLARAGTIAADRHGVSAAWHALTLARVSKALSELSDALFVAALVLAPVPGVGEVLWAAVAVVAVAQLAVDATRYERGDKAVTRGDVAWDAAAVLPLGRLFRGAKSAAQASREIELLPAELRSAPVVPGGLMAHEGTATARGHTIGKHVRISRRALAKRFTADPRLRFSSSFVSRAKAEAAISRVLADSDTAIAGWLRNPRAPLVLEGDFGQVIGRTMDRSGRITKTTKVRVILKKENSMLGYYIKTAFPRL